MKWYLLRRCGRHLSCRRGGGCGRDLAGRDAKPFREWDPGGKQYRPFLWCCCTLPSSRSPCGWCRSSYRWYRTSWVNLVRWKRWTLQSPDFHFSIVSDSKSLLTIVEKISITNCETYANEESKFVVGEDTIWRHHVLGQLHERVFVAPKQLFDRLLDESLLVEDAKQWSSSQTSETRCVLHLGNSRLLKKLEMIVNYLINFARIKGSWNVPWEECWVFGWCHLRYQSTGLHWRRTA